MRLFTPTKPSAKTPDRFGPQTPPTPLERSSASAGPAARLARRASGQAGRQVFPRRRRPLPVVRRLVLVAVLFAALALISVSYRGGTPHMMRGPQTIVLDAVAPIERGASDAWRPLAQSWSWTTGLVHARHEESALRTRVDKLNGEVVHDHVLQDENTQLQAQLGLQKKGRYPDDYKPVSGNMIARPASQLDGSIVTDLGSGNGVAVGDPVMSARGLIGRVTAVSSNASTVALMIEPSQAVSATVLGHDASGVLEPVKNDGTPVMQLQYVQQSAEVHVGNVVVTSGWTSSSASGVHLQSLYPHGIPLGVVTNVGNDPADVYKNVQVTPYADFSRIDVVTVLEPEGAATTTYQQPQTPAVGAPASQVGVPAADTTKTHKAKAASHAAKHTKAAR